VHEAMQKVHGEYKNAEKEMWMMLRVIHAKACCAS
jgi:hypothetical protein